MIKILIKLYLLIYVIDSQDIKANDIENIILNLNPNLTLTSETAIGSLIGTITVLTYSKKNYSSLAIDGDDSYFYLISENLYLKKQISQNQDTVLLKIKASDLNKPTRIFKKYIQLRVETKPICDLSNCGKGIIFDGNKTDLDFLLNFNWSKNYFIGRLYYMNSSNYEYYSSSDYLDVSKDGNITLKKSFDQNNFLKYVDPKLNLNLRIIEKNNSKNEFTKDLKFSFNTSNLQLPPIRLDTKVSVIPRDGEIYFKLGRLNVNQDKYPSSNYKIKVNPSNISIDNDGNLIIQNDIFNKLNSTDTITINIIDNQMNSSVYEETFDLPTISKTTTTTIMTSNSITTTTTTSTSKTTSKSITSISTSTLINTFTNIDTTSNITTFKKPEPYEQECLSDPDCNRLKPGINKCLILSDLKNEKHLTNAQIEYLFRRFQYSSYKDPTILLKYNQINRAIQSPNKETLEILGNLGIDFNNLKTIGICICNKDMTGFRCLDQIPITKPWLCNQNSEYASCNPQTSICKTSEFLLRNHLTRPIETLNEYRSYYCECTRYASTGLNCEFLRNECSLDRYKRDDSPRLYSNPIRFYQYNPMDDLEKNSTKCDSNKEEICFNMYNQSQKFKCLNNKNFINYLTFDETKYKNNSFKNLNLKDSNVLTGLQNFMSDVFVHYSFNNYLKIPKGPIGILKPSVELPDLLSNIRAKINSFTFQNDFVFENLISIQIREIIKQCLNKLIMDKKLNLDASLIDDKVDDFIKSLNLADLKKFSYDSWSLKQTDQDLNQNLKISLDKLKSNLDKLEKTNYLNEVLSLSYDTKNFLNIFKFNDKAYSLFKLDILPGIYLEPNGELSLRPTPGLFLESIPNDKQRTDKEFFFLPGIFNPSSNLDCSISSLFTPGIMSYSVDNFEILNLPNDVNKYLNKFIPIQIPFNINSFLTPLRTSLSETLLTIDKKFDPYFKSYILMTPLDLNFDSSTLDLINKNEKFMSNLFSDQSLAKIVRQQNILNRENLASTLVLSDPSMLSIKDKNYLNLNCNQMIQTYKPKGVQFYNLSEPNQNVTIVPFIIYDQNGDPIQENIINQAIKNYCSSYSDVMNEFHARICSAQNQTDLIKTYSSICPECSYLKLSQRYYSLENWSLIHKSKYTFNLLLFLIILSSVLGFLLLLSLLFLCCCCCRFCPLFGLFGKKKIKKNIQIKTINSSKFYSDDFSASYLTTGDINSYKKRKRSVLSNSTGLSYVNDFNSMKNQSLNIPKYRTDSLSDHHYNNSSINKRSISYPYMNIKDFYLNDIFFDGSSTKHIQNFNINNKQNEDKMFTFEDSKRNFRNLADQRSLPSNYRYIDYDENYEVIETYSRRSKSLFDLDLMDRRCFACDKFSIKDNYSMFICDTCYSKWHVKEKSIDTESRSMDNSYSYYVVRSKNGRRNSTGTIVDVITLDQEKYEPIKYTTSKHSMFKSNKVIVLPVNNEYEHYDQIL